MMLKQMQKKAGFTLVEIIIYIAILVFISTAMVLTFLSLNNVLLRNKTERSLTNAANVSLERVVRDVRAANAVNTLLRTLPDELALDTASGTTTEFYVSSGQLYVDVNSIALGPITPSDVTVEDIVFTLYEGGVSASIDTELVRIALTLSANSKAASTTKTFYTSAVLRGSYE